MNAEEAQQRIWPPAPKERKKKSEDPGNGNGASQVSLPEIQQVTKTKPSASEMRTNTRIVF